MSHKGVFERVAQVATMYTGGSGAFVAALGVILIWIVCGPLFGFSDTWQLVINTGTTIVTFLMVFLIQRSQNKESQAMQLKLNEIVASIDGASNRLLNVEDLPEADVLLLHRHFARLSELCKHDGSLSKSHSVEEADHRHKAKHRSRRQKLEARSSTNTKHSAETEEPRK